jgi:putative transposase
MTVVHDATPALDVRTVCRAVGVPRATYYRWCTPKRTRVSPRKPPPRALSADEKATVLATLNEPRFVDCAPATVVAMLLDENRYLCSERTMYRVLASADQVRERRAHVQRPSYAAPELLATQPNQVWSWDITKLLGPQKWSYYYLYVIMDIFSRYVVGWTVAHRESAALAERLIAETCTRQGITPGQLTIHADRGSSMTSKPVAFLLADLGVTKTHSRPHVSNDNPFSESQFKTLKYRPGFPDRFGGYEDARACVADLLRWYNHEHRHSGLAMLTPADVHVGRTAERLATRNAALATAYARTPERFVRRTPRTPLPPTCTWINPPKSKEAAQ